MTLPEPRTEIDPAVRAMAEVRAREQGISVGEWISRAVFEHGAPPRRHGGLFDPVPYPSVPAVRSDEDLDLWSAGPYWMDTRLISAPRHAGGSGAFDLDVGMWGARHSDVSAIWILAAFPPRIDQAAMLLSAAFAEANVEDFQPPAWRAHRSRKRLGWYDTLVDASLQRSREVRNALVHRWTPTGRAGRLWDDAFLTLCDLTPARQELIHLFERDRPRASSELVKYLELATREFELSANLLAEAEAGAEPSNETRFRESQASLLERSGGGQSLTEAAETLGLTRQGLHKRIRAGTVLGMKAGEEIVLPRLQWTTRDGKTVALPGLAAVLEAFGPAGGWSALQFLIDRDSNLGVAPIDVLRAGDARPVAAAARAYLGLDEG